MIRLGSGKHRTVQSRSGVVLSQLLFAIATVGITASATIAIYQAYEKFIVERRKPAEIDRLRQEKARLAEELTQAQEELILSAAREIEAYGFDRMTLLAPEVREILQERGITYEQWRRLDGLPDDIRRAEELLDAQRVLETALASDQGKMLTRNWSNDSRQRVLTNLQRNSQRFDDMRNRVDEWVRKSKPGLNPDVKDIVKDRVDITGGKARR